MSALLGLLLTGTLAAPVTTFWVERDQRTLRLSTDLAPLFDAALRRRLRSGLTTTIFLDLSLDTHESGATVGALRRLVRVRWDLWDERLTVHHDLPAAATVTYRSVDVFLTDFGRFRAIPIAADVPTDGAVFRVVARVEINPLSAEQLARMRRWLVEPSGGAWSLDPLGSGLLGSFVRLFHNLKPGAAERVLRASGHPFRADRLPFYRRTP